MITGVGDMFDAGEFFVGVQNGSPIVQSVTDHKGDCQTVEVFANAADALARFHNVRRVRLLVDPDPIRAPETWGSIEDGGE